MLFKCKLEFWILVCIKEVLVFKFFVKLFLGFLIIVWLVGFVIVWDWSFFVLLMKILEFLFSSMIVLLVKIVDINLC